MPVADYHERFAAAYDTFYRERDVAGEVGFALDALDLANGRRANASVLDFGCGTGSHVLAFAAAGVRAVGFDRSPAMIAQARAKRPVPGSAELRFEAGSFEGLCGQLDGGRFDGAVSFFNVFNCMESPADMLVHLRLICGTLRPGGRCLVDVWNGAAVFGDQPHPSVRHYDLGASREMIRITDPAMDRVGQVCSLRYRVLTLNRGGGTFEEFESLHTLHFLTPVQYRHLFELAGFAVLEEFPTRSRGERVSEHDWYITYLLGTGG